MLSAELFPIIAAAPMMRIPVPKKKDEAMEMPKYFLKMILRKVYRLAQPRLMTILPKIALTSDQTLTANDVCVSAPAITPPNR